MAEGQASIAALFGEVSIFAFVCCGEIVAVHVGVLMETVNELGLLELMIMCGMYYSVNL